MQKLEVIMFLTDVRLFQEENEVNETCTLCTQTLISAYD